MRATSKLRSPLPSPDRPLLIMRGRYLSLCRQSNKFEANPAYIQLCVATALISDKHMRVYYAQSLVAPCAHAQAGSAAIQEGTGDGCTPVHTSGDGGERQDEECGGTGAHHGLHLEE